MAITNALASVAVTDLNASVQWYERLFGRPADATPMPEVVEWKVEGGGGLQVYELEQRAGACSATLAVDDFDEQVERLRRSGIDPGHPMLNDRMRVIMTKDPDGNSIALAQARPATSSVNTAAAARAQSQNDASSRRELIRQSLPGEPARDLTLVEVRYPPSAGSPPHLHRHGVMAFVVSGSIASQVGDAPEKTFRAGEVWWEPPGAEHRVSRNVSATDPATLLAIYIAPAGASDADLMKPM
jgi:quercetin dioxygenase-like cupin family protein/predicted enzyme related to lactoylglutathione lyase